MNVMSTSLSGSADRRLRTLSVAVIDNDQPVGPLIRDSLAMWQIRGTRIFDHAAGALAALAVSPPDIVFINWNGARHDAAQVARAIRDRETFPHSFLALCMVMADVTRDRVLQARDAGVDEFLACPFTPKALYQRISSIVFDRRGFVSVPGYFGPDRRRGAMAQYLGVNRRSGATLLIDPGSEKVYLDLG